MNNFFLKKKLGETTGIKSENLQVMRLIAALMVIVSNAYFISTGTDDGELFLKLTNNQISMKEFALAIFFLCGGYLIAKSVEAHATAKSFFEARVKRLFPSAFTVVVATLVICSFISGWKPLGYVVSEDTLKYALNAVFIYVKELPGVFQEHPTAIVNGAYGTMTLAVICYVLCFVAYKIRLLEQKKFVFTIPVVVAAGAVAWKLSASYDSLYTMFCTAALFYIGVGYWVYREKIALELKYFVIASLAFVLLFVVGGGQLAMFTVFPYILMYISFGIKQCPKWLGRIGNYAYGTFLWGFFVQQMVLFFWPENMMFPKINVFIAVPISVFLGALTYEIVDNKAKDIPAWAKKLKCPDIVYIALLVIYALRHVDWGLDLWDTGYSYSNFQYMSFDHMDTMWLFSTYLANVVGNLITKLPFAETMLGMNFYTTMLVAFLAIIGYFFCTRALKMSRWIVFIGEMLTIALYWCPNGVLYNYVTYILVVLSVIFIYLGLTQGKNIWLFVAGVCLGANILTRFSNLPQAALILAVWTYGFLESKESKEKGVLKKTINRTLWCIAGWGAGFGAFMLYIHFRYGIEEYINGITRLFAMTEVAEGYTPTGMLSIISMQFWDEFPWLKELGIYILKGFIVWLVIDLIKKEIKYVREHVYLQIGLNIFGIISSVRIGMDVVNDLYMGLFAEMNYFAYTSIQGPAIVFMMLTAIIAGIKLCREDTSKDEKLVGILIVLLLMVNSIGSSNGLYSSFNNLCLAAPYTIWHIYQYTRHAKDMILAEISFSSWPVKTVLIAFLYVVCWQAWLFGQYFFFTEAMSAKEIVATVENNDVLDGIKMEPHKAEWLTSISKYVNENELEGREVVLYGNIPAMSYYLQMPPAFNSWPDLGSYNIKQMKLDMKELQDEIDRGDSEMPVVLVEASYSQNTSDAKWSLIMDFMEENNYECTFYNGKFVMYEPMLSE